MVTLNEGQERNITRLTAQEERTCYHDRHGVGYGALCHDGNLLREGVFCVGTGNYIWNARLQNQRYGGFRSFSSIVCRCVDIQNTWDVSTFCVKGKLVSFVLLLLQLAYDCFLVGLSRFDCAVSAQEECESVQERHA